MPMIAGLDIATTTGVAVLDGDRFVMAGDIVSKGERPGQVFRHFRKTLYELIGKHSITKIAAEQPLRTDIELKTGKLGPDNREIITRPPMKTYLRIYGLFAVAQEVCEAREVEFFEVNQATWRKAFTGNGHASKEETLALARRISRTIDSEDAAEALGVAWWLRGELNPLIRGAHDDLFAPRPATPQRERTPF